MAKGKSNTGLIVGVSVGAVALLGIGGTVLYFATRGGNTDVEVAKLRQLEQAGDAAARVAEANASVEQARQAAKIAEEQRKASEGDWYDPLLGGIGKAIGSFDWGAFI